MELYRFSVFCEENEEFNCEDRSQYRSSKHNHRLSEFCGDHEFNILTPYQLAHLFDVHVCIKVPLT